MHTNIGIEAQIHSYSKRNKNIDFHSLQSSTEHGLKRKGSWEILLAYRPSSMVARNSLFKDASGLLEDEAELERSLLTTKAGCLGTGSVAVSLLSITTATAMVGRSLGSSCTHNSPTFTHLRNSFVLHV